MERIVHKSKTFDEAADWDVEQQLAMSPQERMAIAKRLKERVYGSESKDVRECHLEN